MVLVSNSLFSHTSCEFDFLDWLLESDVAEDSIFRKASVNISFSEERIRGMFFLSITPLQ